MMSCLRRSMPSIKHLIFAENVWTVELNRGVSAAYCSASCCVRVKRTLVLQFAATTVSWSARAASLTDELSSVLQSVSASAACHCARLTAPAARRDRMTSCQSGPSDGRLNASSARSTIATLAVVCHQLASARAEWYTWPPPSPLHRSVSLNI